MTAKDANGNPLRYDTTYTTRQGHEVTIPRGSKPYRISDMGTLDRWVIGVEHRPTDPQHPEWTPTFNWSVPLDELTPVQHESTHDADWTAWRNANIPGGE